MRILIAVPTFETIAPEVFKAIYDLKSEHELAFEFVKGYDCAEARNRIAELTLAGEYDYVLMVDSDTVIPPDTLDSMLDPPVDICIGCCPRKNTTQGKTALVKVDERVFDSAWYYKDLPEGRFEIKAGGFACALVKTDVFRRVSQPWFRYAIFDNGGTLSEDYYFCNNARFEHIQIWADGRVRCGHLARYYQYE